MTHEKTGSSCAHLINQVRYRNKHLTRNVVDWNQVRNQLPVSAHVSQNTKSNNQTCP